MRRDGKSDGADGADGWKVEGRRRLRPSGGYRELRSFQVATIVYDATVSFCEKFVDKRSRTHDQMVQAARSGRQNIAEGSRDSATSSQTELRLVNIARGSLEELLLDYEDYLRHRGKGIWDKNDPEAREVRAIGSRKNRTDGTDRTDGSAYARWLDDADPAVAANALICLIHQANYLIDQQLVSLERDFIQQGGYSEQLAAARIAERQKKIDPSNLTDQSDSAKHAPACPICGKPMALRTAKKGPKPGSQFWGCSAYPQCKATQPLETPDRSDRKNP